MNSYFLRGNPKTAPRHVDKSLAAASLALPFGRTKLPGKALCEPESLHISDDHDPERKKDALNNRLI